MTCELKKKLHEMTDKDLISLLFYIVEELKNRTKWSVR